MRRARDIKPNEQFAVDPDGYLGRPVAIDELFIPDDIWVDRGQVCYRSVWSERGQNRGHWHRVDDGLLDHFIGLREAEPREILKFAKQYGPLHLCGPHELPIGHPHVAGKGTLCGMEEGEKWIPNDIPVFSELLDSWRFHATNAFRILWVTAHLRRALELKEADWPTYPCRYVSDPDWRRVNLLGRTSLQGLPPLPDWLRLAAYIDWWLWTAQIHPRIYCSSPGRITTAFAAAEIERPVVRDAGKKDAQILAVVLRSTSLFGAIGLQLLTAVMKASALLICSACALPYLARRKPVGRDNYCRSCGRGAAMRAASARYYKKQKIKRKKNETAKKRA
jgi:hypothetical protein